MIILPEEKKSELMGRQAQVMCPKQCRQDFKKPRTRKARIHLIAKFLPSQSLCSNRRKSNFIVVNGGRAVGTIRAG